MHSRLPGIAAVAAVGFALCTPLALEGQQTPYPTITQERDAGQQQDRSRQRRGAAATMPQMQQPPSEITGTRPVRMVLAASADQIVSNPSLYYGVPVSVHAGIDEVYGRQAFTLDEEGWLQGSWFGDQLMVLNPNPDPGLAALDQDDYVTVVGTVRMFVKTELERDFDWFDDVPDINIEMEGRPVIVAESIRTSDGAQLVQNPPDTTMLIATTAGRIADVPGRYFGRNVSVRAEVEDVVSRRMFTLDEDKLFAGPDVLVINPFPAVTPNDDEIVTIVGTVRPLVIADFERDYDWFDAADYGADLETYERRPAIVAHSIIGDRQWVLVQPELNLQRSEEMLARRMEEQRQRQARAGQPGTQQQAGQQQRPAEQRQAEERPAGTAGEQPIEDISGILDAADPSAILDRPVDLQDVRVQQVMDGAMVWIGTDAQRRILLLLPEGAPTNLAVGERVDVRGTVIGSGSIPGNVQARHAIRASEVSRRQ